jgi:hypothetical protein
VHKDCIQGEDVLDLTIFDISHRDFVSTSNPIEKLTNKKGKGSEGQKKEEKMRMMFWNTRGLGKPSRRKQVREFITEENMEGIGLRQTMKEDFS